MEIEKISRNEYKFIFFEEDHTLGNLLQKELLKDSSVFFAGYSVPHPLESKMIIKIISKDKNPREIMINTFNKILTKLNQLSLIE